IEKLKALYEEALAVEDVVGLSIGTRPDCISEPILKLLQEYASDYLIWIEYGLQSANNSTLLFINRGHDFKCFKGAVEMSQGRNLKICAHIILGLPNEGKKQIRETANAVANLGIDGIKLHLLYVIKDTKLEQLYNEGKYKCLEQQEYIDNVSDFLEYIPGNIVIQRLTSDPHRNELVAPAWALNKQETLDLIEKTLEKRDSYQGIKSSIKIEMGQIEAWKKPIS
ncbi:MAG: TIGR01212 family radical SAM protein, partial [Desulfobacterales bacterium]|nr:TIGR01212 family radical SAM protein [Desulfobacterales bacterium]